MSETWLCRMQNQLTTGVDAIRWAKVHHICHLTLGSYLILPGHLAHDQGPTGLAVRASRPEDCGHLSDHSRIHNEHLCSKQCQRKAVVSGSADAQSLHTFHFKPV
eukprot:scaffold248883_cov43-Prasinocladus_malaysianus.AAC.2